jgi:hypothetical protein
MQEVVASGLPSKVLVIPLVIMQVLHAFRMCMEGEIVDIVTSCDIVTEHTLTNCGYQHNEREYR